MADYDRSKGQEEFLTWEEAVEIRDQLKNIFSQRAATGARDITNPDFVRDRPESVKAYVASADAAAKTAEEIINLARYVKENNLQPKQTTLANG